MIVIDQASRLQIFHAERALKEQICLTLTGNHLCRIQADCSHKQTPPCLWLTTESHVFTGPPMPIQELIMCVPFCGGISGWQHAVRMLQTCGYPIRTAIACDTSPEAVRSFCSTHGFGLGSVPFSTEVPPGPFAYVADASQGQFWMFAAAQKCNIATASWPCQSFSLAGGRQGWSAPGGLAFKDMLAFCSICGIQFVLLENVPEVWSDLGLRATLIANVLSEGYRFIFAEVLKLEHVVPVQRSRFIGVITKLAHVQWTPQHAGKVKQAFQGPLRSLQLESMWFAEVPAALMTQSLLTSQEIEIYSCVRRSPKQVATAKDALLRRVISPEARIPATSLMRSYTRQHLFHGVAHGTDKLLGDLRTQQDKLRFFTPVEIIAALGITNPVDLPIDIVSGSQQVGNSIAEVHALAGIWVALVCCGFEFEGITQSFEQIIRKFRATRLDTQADILIQDDRCLFGSQSRGFHFRTLRRHEVVLVLRYEDASTQTIPCVVDTTFGDALQQLEFNWSTCSAFFGSRHVLADDIIRHGGIVNLMCAPTPVITPTIQWEVGSVSTTATSNAPGPGDALAEVEPRHALCDFDAVGSPASSDGGLSYNNCEEEKIDMQVYSEHCQVAKLQVRSDLTGCELNRAWNLLRGSCFDLHAHTRIADLAKSNGFVILRESPDEGNLTWPGFFLKIPGGDTRSCKPARYESLGFVIQSSWPEFNPALHKVHSGARLFDPQESIRDLHIRAHAEVQITCRAPGGAKPALNSEGDGLAARIQHILKAPTRSTGEVSEVVNSFCSKLSDTQRAGLTKTPTGDELRKMLRATAKDVGFPIAQLFPKRGGHLRSSQPPVRLCIHDVTFLPGTFFFEDKSEAKVQGPFDISQRGLYTEPPTEIDEILASGKALASYELGYIQLEPPPAGSKFPATKIRCPAKDAAGHTLILQCWILQLGGQRVQLRIMTFHANPAESFASQLFGLTGRQLLFRGNCSPVRLQRPSLSYSAPLAMTFMRFGDASGTAQTAEGGQPRQSQILFVYISGLQTASCVQFWRRVEPPTPQFLLTPLKTRTPMPCPSPSLLFVSFGSQKKSELQKPSPFTTSTLDWFVGATTLVSELQNQALMRCGRQSTRANLARPGFKSITNGDYLESHRKQAWMRSIGSFSCSRLMEKFYVRLAKPGSLAPHGNSRNSPGPLMAILSLQSRYMTSKSSLIRLLHASRNPHFDPEQMRLITFGRPRRSTSCRSQILGPGHRGQPLQASSFRDSVRRMRCNCNSNRNRSQSCNPVC